MNCILQTKTSSHDRPPPPLEAENTAVDETAASDERSFFHSSPSTHIQQQTINTVLPRHIDRQRVINTVVPLHAADNG